jgi:hypothetical protein
MCGKKLSDIIKWPACVMKSHDAYDLKWRIVFSTRTYTLGCYKSSQIIKKDYKQGFRIYGQLRMSKASTKREWVWWIETTEVQR